MKRLKPLINVELKPVLGISIYFMIVNILSFANIKQDMNGFWRNYLSQGMIGLYDRGNRVDWLKDIFLDQISLGIGLYLIGIIFLTFASFKQDKSIETSRFLKSLPFTSRERSLVKVALGGLSCTITFGIYTLGLSILLVNYAARMKEIYEVTAINQIAGQLFNIPQLLVIMFVGYLVVLAFYLFCVLVQYAVSHRMGSAVIAVCTIIAPFFLLRSISYCFELGRESVLFKIGEWLVVLVFGGQVPMQVTVAGYEEICAFYSYTQYMLGYQMIFYIALIIALVFAIWKLSKLQLLEEADKLIPITGLRWLFIVGVTLCGGFLACDVYLNSIEPLLERSIFIGKWLTLGGGFIISYFIAKKIAFIGIDKRKGVRV